MTGSFAVWKGLKIIWKGSLASCRHFYFTGIKKVILNWCTRFFLTTLYLTINYVTVYLCWNYPSVVQVNTLFVDTSMYDYFFLSSYKSSSTHSSYRSIAMLLIIVGLLLFFYYSWDRMNSCAKRYGVKRSKKAVSTFRTMNIILYEY